MVVDLVFQSFLADLVEPVELVKINAETIWHDEPMEDYGHATLLTEPGRADLFRFSQYDRAVWNENVLVVVRVKRVRDKHLHGSGRVTVQTIHQDGVEGRSLEDDIGLAHGGIDVYLRATLRRRSLSRCRRFLTCGASRR